MSTKKQFAHCIWCDKPVRKISFFRRIFFLGSPQRQLLCDVCRTQALRLFEKKRLGCHGFDPYDPPVLELVPEMKSDGSGVVDDSATLGHLVAGGGAL